MVNGVSSLRRGLPFNNVGLPPRINQGDALLLRFVAEGHCDKEIAQKVGMSSRGVAGRIQKIARRMGADGRGRAYLVICALRYGYIRLGELAL